MIYDYIYDFYYGLFSSNYLSGYQTNILGVDTTLSTWISHTATIISMSLLLALLFYIVKWVFKVFAGLWNRF